MAEVQTLDNEKQIAVENSYDRCSINSLGVDKERMVALILSVYNYRDDDLSNISVLRSLFCVLIGNGYVSIDFDCNNLPEFLKKGKRLGKNSMSPSVQWINIDANLGVDFKVKFKKTLQEDFSEAYSKYLSKSVDKTGLDDKVKQILTVITDKLTHVLFAKLSLEFDSTSAPFGDIQLAVRKYKREICFYKHMTKLVYEKHLPGCPTYIGDIRCLPGTNTPASVVINENFSPEMNIGDVVFGDVSKNVKSAHVMFTEFMANAMPFEDFVQKVFINKISSIDQDAITSFFKVMFQIVYILNIFYQVGFVHNDLHLKNIMIEKLSKPVTYYFFVDDDISSGKYTSYKITTDLLVKIFDFDLSLTVSGDMTGDITVDGEHVFSDKFGVPNRLASKIVKNPDVEAVKNIDFFWMIRSLYNQRGKLLKSSDLAVQRDYDKVVNFLRLLLNNKDPVGIFEKNTPDFIIKEFMTPQKLLQNVDFHRQLSDAGILIERDISTKTQFDFDNVDEIFLTYNCMRNDNLSNIINASTDWQSTNIYKRLLMCAPLVSQQELTTEIFSKSQITKSFALKALPPSFEGLEPTNPEDEPVPRYNSKLTKTFGYLEYRPEILGKDQSSQADQIEQVEHRGKTQQTQQMQQIQHGQGYGGTSQNRSNNLNKRNMKREYSLNKYYYAKLNSLN
ncbi:hypothetical protein YASMINEVIRUS_829 [Yasminevirus sp. GU-2018]|uniref:Protein kinase domain-containing protein n=1 Tax=Yasminevirus sp. GU-2018 TaxID=2420051 RepID=A0A5K0UBA8_9VIRU|nr:hypothetical protein YASMINEVIRUS_829 [Yasminevirus sp. GU-2018]